MTVTASAGSGLRGFLNGLPGVAAAELAGSGIHAAAVATAFPSGRASLAVKLADVASAVAGG